MKMAITLNRVEYFDNFHVLIDTDKSKSMTLPNVLFYQSEIEPRQTKTTVL